LVHDIADNEMKLQRAARKLDEMMSDSATEAAISGHMIDLRSTLDAISLLKYRAVESKQKKINDIEQREEDKSRAVKFPQLPVLPPTIEELKQKIAMHNVSSVW